ncbi:MAG: hypothetical protein KZQ76_15260 [Candidatus Thiodiazotropha sp. (ex Epidulcina cf. delphinae)]|nr:hypothetical protein [Candidatus Thiodiazotropha sp. (ex Epidulcina cf. delphinae)]
MKMKMLQQAAAVLAAAGFFTAVVAGEDVFGKLDSDADGVISSEEASANEVLYKGWESADANQDGSVDAAEFSAFETHMPEGE